MLAFALASCVVGGVMLGRWSLDDGASADGRCGERHGQTWVHAGHVDGDADGIVCDGVVGPLREVRVAARRMSGGDVQVSVQHRAVGGRWSEYVELEADRLRSGAVEGRWYHSSSLVLP